MKKITKVKDLKEGLLVTANIEGEDISEARITIEDGDIFICQNIADGDECENKYGFQYSWLVYLDGDGELCPKDYDIHSLCEHPNNKFLK